MQFCYFIPTTTRGFGMAAEIQISLYFFEMPKQNPCSPSVGQIIC